MKYRRLIIFILLFSSAKLFSQITGNLLKVQGESILYELPANMEIQIPISSDDSVYSKCSDKLIENYNSIVSELNTNGIDKSLIKSESMQIDENYNWTDRERKLVGYRGTINVIVTLSYSPTMLSRIINSLKDNEIKTLYHISFKLSNEQKSDLLQKAIQVAINDASNKAKIIAESLKLKLVEIKEVNFGYSIGEFDQLVSEDAVYYQSALMDSNPITVLQLNPEKLEIRKSIGIIWKIEK